MLEIMDLDVSTDGDVGVIRLCRPPHNFFDVDLVAGIVAAIEGMVGAQRVVVLHAEGRNFCAGADLTRGSAAVFSATGEHLYEHALALYRQPLPIVAAVQGKAVGGGLGLALAADLRVGTPQTAFVANFAAIGIHQGFGLSVTLPNAVGPHRAMDMLYTGRPVVGAEALRFGLLDRLVEADPFAEAMTLARSIAAFSADVLVSIRTTLRRSMLDALRDAMDHERVEQERLRPSLRPAPDR
jgi:2-(1,2-epoxy-1,2-dihydrophenyl)acetyl-CoA isomerase